MAVAILETLTLLCAELEAIEFWNATYRRKGKPEAYETIAFRGRKKRRSEIIRQICFLTRGPWCERIRVYFNVRRGKPCFVSPATRQNGIS